MPDVVSVLLPDTPGAGTVSADKVHLSLSGNPGFRLREPQGSYPKSVERIGENAVRFGVRHCGRIVHLDVWGDTRWSLNRGGGRRSYCRDFSFASRRRLLQRIGSLDFQMSGEWWFVTLTYPGEFPLDVAECKRHLANLRRRLSRRLGSQLWAFWKVEFQGRGAPHFHLMLRRPESAFGDPGPLGDLSAFRAWLAEAWFSVVDSGDDRHLLAGTQVQRAYTDCARYFAYMLSDKAHQDRAPWFVGGVGRRWGVWGYRPEWTGSMLTREQWCELRRVLARWEQGHGTGHVSRRGRIRSTWLLFDPGKGSGFYRLLRSLPEVRLTS